VLAATHEASATGSVRAFVATLAALDDELVVACKQAGPLLEEIASHATRVLCPPRPRVAQLRRVVRVRQFSGVEPIIEGYIARSIIAEVQPDFVYANTVFSSEYATAAIDAGIPHLLHVHEQEPLSSWALSRARTPLAAVRAVVPSEYVAREIAALGCTVEQVILGPVDPNETGLPEPLDLPWTADAYRVLACGTAAEWKGVDEFIAAARQLTALAGRRVEWAWLGSGDALDELRRRTADISDRVFWLGGRPNASPYLRSADLLVLTSRRDSAPLVVLEAAIQGVPTIGFGVGGFPEMARDPRAVARPADVNDLVTRVSATLRDSSRAAALLANIQRSAHDAAQFSSRIAALVRQLAEQGAASHATSS
jgi:glycosyltransferase involved in cell wall biosynthesis